jgi:hypothetical protein
VVGKGTSALPRLSSFSLRLKGAHIKPNNASRHCGVWFHLAEKDLKRASLPFQGLALCPLFKPPDEATEVTLLKPDGLLGFSLAFLVLAVSRHSKVTIWHLSTGFRLFVNYCGHR